MTSCPLIRRKLATQLPSLRRMLSSLEESRTEKCYAPVTVLAATFGKQEDWTLRIKVRKIKGLDLK